MFDMIKTVDRRQMISSLVTCLPMLLVIGSQLAGEMLPSIWIGIALYFIFRWRKNTDSSEE